MTCHKANARLMNRPNVILFSDKVITTPSVHDDGRARWGVYAGTWRRRPQHRRRRSRLRSGARLKGYSSQSEVPSID